MEFGLVPKAEVTEQSFYSRHGFALLVGAFVISTSFLYGISAGLAKRSDRLAVASLSPFDEPSPSESRIQLPEDVTVVPLGREMEINGKAAEAVSFVTDRGIKELFKEQVARWEEKGAKVMGVATGKRGFAVGFNESTGERFSMSASLLPSVLGDIVAGGHSVQGFISVVDMGKGVGEAGGGEVPGVPVLGGGQGGTVVSSLDRGGRSVTGVYTIPGSVELVAELYRDELAARGWRAVQEGLPTGRALASAVGSLRFVQRGEEIVLLLSPGKTDAPGAAQTVVMVSRAPASDARVVR